MSEGNFKEKEKLVKGPKWAPDTKTDWPTDCRSQINFNFTRDSVLDASFSCGYNGISIASKISTDRPAAIQPADR
jgi:hypothetical protein